MSYTIRRNCRHFRGDIPCRPHKLYGVICEGCSYYDSLRERILIVKLAAAGDVIRTTPLLRKLRATYPAAWITWLTETPEVVPCHSVLPEGADEVLRWGPDSTLIVEGQQWDWVILLDKDRPACSLADRLHAKRKSGFTLEFGRPAPRNAAAEDKFLTGIDDRLNRANALSYPQEIFRICDYEFGGEEYVLDPCLNEPVPSGLPRRRPLVGLNTGCGGRWPMRMWPERHWAELASSLTQAGYGVILLGGPQEHEMNQRIAAMSETAYLGHFSLRQFIRLIGVCDGVVTAVTMAMHLAIGLQKKLILFNNIFNPREFELYGRGEILEPDPACECTFPLTCDRQCMDRLSPERVLAAVRKHVPLA